MCSRVDGRTACPCMLGAGAVPLEPHLCFLGVDSSNPRYTWGDYRSKHNTFVESSLLESLNSC